MEGSELRRLPRIPYDGIGELVVDSKVIPVVVSSVACEGVGVSFNEEHRMRIRPLADTTLRFLGKHDAGVTAFELPARVVWSAGNHAGLRLRLRDADASDRKSYGAWIAPRTKAALANRAEL